ncbi:hypothetical protein HDU76_011155 [Blyttiomyces sp. JEL0837]|nr:hypothetical protein HDU76_011155 [Blyttiomyces sp. JEL0837]
MTQPVFIWLRILNLLGFTVQTIVHVLIFLNHGQNKSPSQPPLPQPTPPPLEIIKDGIITSSSSSSSSSLFSSKTSSSSSSLNSQSHILSFNEISIFQPSFMQRFTDTPMGSLPSLPSNIPPSQLPLIWVSPAWYIIAIMIPMLYFFQLVWVAYQFCPGTFRVDGGFRKWGNRGGDGIIVRDGVQRGGVGTGGGDAVIGGDSASVVSSANVGSGGSGTTAGGGSGGLLRWGSRGSRRIPSGLVGGVAGGTPAVVGGMSGIRQSVPANANVGSSGVIIMRDRSGSWVSGTSPTRSIRRVSGSGVGGVTAASSPGSVGGSVLGTPTLRNFGTAGGQGSSPLFPRQKKRFNRFANSYQLITRRISYLYASREAAQLELDYPETFQPGGVDGGVGQPGYVNPVGPHVRMQYGSTRRRSESGGNTNVVGGVLASSTGSIVGGAGFPVGASAAGTASSSGAVGGGEREPLLLGGSRGSAIAVARELRRDCDIAAGCDERDSWITYLCIRVPFSIYLGVLMYTSILNLFLIHLPILPTDPTTTLPAAQTALSLLALMGAILFIISQDPVVSMVLLAFLTSVPNSEPVRTFPGSSKGGVIAVTAWGAASGLAAVVALVVVLRVVVWVFCGCGCGWEGRRGGGGGIIGICGGDDEDEEDDVRSAGDGVEVGGWV